MQSNAINKQEWITLFQEIGLNNAQMERWHQLFEQRHPDGHQSFLTWLGLPKEEIHNLRSQFANR